MDERRSTDRAPTENRVELRILAFPRGPRPRRKTLQCVTTDVSPGGTRLTLMGRYTDKRREGDVDMLDRMEKGARVRLTVSFKRPRKRFKLEGVVRWVRREPGSVVFVVGLEFEDISERARRSWQQYVARHFPQTQSNA